MRILLFFALFLSFYSLVTMGFQNSVWSGSLPPVYVNALIFALASFILVPLFRKFVDKKSVVPAALNIKASGNDMILGFLLATAILGIGSLILYFNRNLEFFGTNQISTDFFTGLGLMCLIAFSEELVFRSYILGNLLGSFQKWWALIISAALFALVHIGNPEVSVLAIINVFVAGILLGLNYIYTGSLWFSIVFHFAWNFLQGPVLGFDVSGLKLESIVQVEITGNVFLTGGRFGFEASILETILFLLAIALVGFYYEGRDIPIADKNQINEMNNN